MANTKTLAKNVSMYPDDWEIVEKVANTPDYLFDGNTSQALRYIVRDWAKAQREISGVRLSQEELARADILT